MSVAEATPSSDTAKATPGMAVPRTARDIRLDVFRGLAMFIILIAHVPGNLFTLYIPARFGFSDATEIFVFCSGMASAVAFGSTYAKKGFWLGTARVIYRCWQVYWAHIGLFFGVAATMVLLNYLSPIIASWQIGSAELQSCVRGVDPIPCTRDYVGQLNLYVFFRDAPEKLLELLTLRYVTNYFDILPMYLIVLLMMPLIMWLKRIDVLLAVSASLLVWVLAQADWLSLPTTHYHNRATGEPGVWFFNPFGWQLIFFTGFAFMAGWLPKPPRLHERGGMPLAGFAIAFVLFAAITDGSGTWRIFPQPEWIIRSNQWPDKIDFLHAKTDFGVFRYLHFLSLAYLVWLAVGVQGHRLQSGSGNGVSLVKARFLRWIITVGQQSLAIFMTSMWLSRIMGFALDQIGRNVMTTVLVNFMGFAILILVAYAVKWFKSQPWRQKVAA